MKKTISTEIENGTTVQAPVVYFEQAADACVDLYDASLYRELNNRQFEWAGCGYFRDGFETELVSAELNENYLPEALSGGKNLANRGVKAENFARWFSEVEGASTRRQDFLSLEYDNGTFQYDGKTSEITGVGLYTLNLAVPIQVLRSGEEEFTITADDDTWVYVGSRLVLDMGGVHEAASAKFAIRENGEIYSGVGTEDLAYSGVTLEGESAMVRIFHANRDSGTEAEFKFAFRNMILNVDENMQVAYNPDEPGYMAPLGTSLTVGASVRQSVMDAMVTETWMLVGLMVVMIAAISLARRYLRRGRNQG